MLTALNVEMRGGTGGEKECDLQEIRRAVWRVWHSYSFASISAYAFDSYDRLL